MPKLTSICVFCGASPGSDRSYVASAIEVGQLLASRGVRLVYGGGRVGLMGAVADAALRMGGEVIGVIPAALADKEVAHRGLTRLHVVTSMHERKAAMAELADGFMALPGGIGTLEEFFETWTWAQLGMHRKPFGLLNVAGFFDPLLEFVDHLVGQGFLRPEHRGMLHTRAICGDLVDAMADHRPIDAWAWLSATNT